MDTTKSCPFCAEQIHLNAIFCKHCRKDLNPQTENDKREEEIPIFGVIALGVGLFSFALPFFLGFPFAVLGLFLGLVSIRKKYIRTGWWAIIFSSISFFYATYSYWQIQKSVKVFENNMREIERDIKKLDSEIEQSIK